MSQNRFDFGQPGKREAAQVRVAAQAAALGPGERPAGWRAPTRGEHACGRCGGAAGFGLGEQWFCRACAPADFLPAGRRA